MAPALSGIRDEGGVVMKDHCRHLRNDAPVALHERRRSREKKMWSWKAMRTDCLRRSLTTRRSRCSLPSRSAWHGDLVAPQRSGARLSWQQCSASTEEAISTVDLTFSGGRSWRGVGKADVTGCIRVDCMKLRRTRLDARFTRTHACASCSVFEIRKSAASSLDAVGTAAVGQTKRTAESSETKMFHWTTTQRVVKQRSAW